MFDELKTTFGVDPEWGSRSLLWAPSSQLFLLQWTDPHSLLQGKRAEQQGLGTWDTWWEGQAGCEEGEEKAAALSHTQGSHLVLWAMDDWSLLSTENGILRDHCILGHTHLTIPAPSPCASLGILCNSCSSLLAT